MGLPGASCAQWCLPKVCDWSIMVFSALRNHSAGCFGVTDVKGLHCNGRFCRLQSVEQTYLYSRYLPQITDPWWAFTHTCPPVKFLGWQGRIIGVTLIATTAPHSWCPHEGGDTMSPCLMLPGWKVKQELKLLPPAMCLEITATLGGSRRKSLACQGWHCALPLPLDGTSLVLVLALLVRSSGGLCPSCCAAAAVELSK